MNDQPDPHVAVIAADVSHDQRQVDFEINTSAESVERMFELLIKRLEEAKNQLNLVEQRVVLKRDKYRQDCQELQGYANGTLEQLGSFGLLVAKIADVVDGVPDPARRKNGSAVTPPPRQE